MKKLNVLNVVAVLLTVGVLQAAIVNPADSSGFLYKYEGGAIVQDGSTASGFGTTGYSGSMTGSTLVSDGDILSVTTTGPGVFYLQNPTWIAQAVGSAGWTWEARIKMANVAGNTLNFRVGDGDDTDKEDIFIWWPDRIRSSWTDGWGLLDTTDDYHVYRIAQAAGSDSFNIWIDGQLATEYDFVTMYPTYGYAGTDHWFGDGSGSSFAQFDLDYVRWTTGGYSPIPEPATCLTLGLGALMLYKRRQNSKK